MVFFNSVCNPTNLSVYHVKKIQEAIEVTGLGTDTHWKEANILTNFTYPWRDETPPSTEFKSLWNESHFYFLYTVEDHEIITPQRGLGEQDAVNSDRVEIFFKADDNMDPYYALEMDALGRCLDTEGRYHRNIDYKWNWPKGHFILKASQHDDGYQVEGSITLASLRQLGMYKDDRLLRAGLFRGEYYTKENKEVGIKWISWVIPDSETPDFHIPSSFGLLKLID